MTKDRMDKATSSRMDKTMVVHGMDKKVDMEP